MISNDHTLADLYRRIVEFDIDGEPAEFSFTRRLARENGWSIDFAYRVVGEYKRFLFLLVAAGHPVTPSDQVDQAWHLHLAYTKSYWERLCGEVVGQPLHHVPTVGGAEEAQKFDHWYKRTLQRYEQFFGHPPPSDIWPSPAVRFGDDLHFRRVNTRRNWVFRNPIRTRRRLSTVIAQIGLTGLLGGGAVVATSTSSIATHRGESSSEGWDWQWLFFIGVVIYGLVKWLMGLQCPSCRRYQLRKTGVDEKRVGDTWEEFSCKNCGHRQWKEEEEVAYGGGGCGGCGGCGG